MSNNVVLQPTAQSAATIIAIMSGRLTVDGELTKCTEKKLGHALTAAKKIHSQNSSGTHLYIIPDCTRHESGGQRVCDVLRLMILSADVYCQKVIVPEADAELLTENERTAFFYKTKAGIKGDCIMLV